MSRGRFDAMGTSVSVLVPLAWQDLGLDEVQRLFALWEQTFSRFLPDSELTFVNANAGKPVVVSPLFLQVAEEALRASRATGGLYDPTMLRHLVAAGYDRSFTDLSTEGPDAPYEAPPTGGWKSVRIDAQRREIMLPRHVALDFGGIAKGMAVDEAVNQLIVKGVPRAAVEAGGDLRVHGNPPLGRGWNVAVEVKDGHESISLFYGALATSSISKRRWKRGASVRHHILDPRTGAPADNEMWSVSVAAPRCVQADVAAKTALILGPEAGSRFLRKHQLAALMVMGNGSRLHIGEWPEQSNGCDA